MTTIGWYGKLPALGDFASRRLPPEFIQRWDDWLQQVVAGSQAILGERWLDTYLTSDIWRFAIAPGCLTPQAWAGVMLPSVDRVGRYYPLCIAAPLTAQTASFGWFGTLEQCAHLALRTIDVEQFDSALFDIALQPVEDVSAQTEILGPASMQKTRYSIDLILNNGLSGHSLWFVELSIGGRSEFLHAGMPDAAAYACMLQRT